MIRWKKIAACCKQALLSYILLRELTSSESYMLLDENCFDIEIKHVFQGLKVVRYHIACLILGNVYFCTDPPRNAFRSIESI